MLAYQTRLRIIWPMLQIWEQLSRVCAGVLSIDVGGFASLHSMLGRPLWLRRTSNKRFRGLGSLEFWQGQDVLQVGVQRLHRFSGPFGAFLFRTNIVAISSGIDADQRICICRICNIFSEKRTSCKRDSASRLERIPNHGENGWK